MLLNWIRKEQIAHVLINSVILQEKCNFNQHPNSPKAIDYGIDGKITN